MSKFDSFIAAYKDYEAACREIEKAPAEVETDVDIQAVPSLTDKLRVCRIIRNYVQHNAGYENFLDVTKEQIRLLNDTANYLRCRNGVIKDSDMYKTWAKAHAVDKSASLSDCLPLIAKYRCIPIIDSDKSGSKTFSGILDEHTTIKMLADGKKKVNADFDAYQCEVRKRYIIHAADGKDPVTSLDKSGELPTVYIVKTGNKETGWIILN